MKMDRDSIPQMNALGRARGMSYGEYVAAAYYPVVILEELPGGEQVERWASLPHAQGAPEMPAEPRRRPEKKPVSKAPGRKCAVCGAELKPNQRKFCSDECKTKEGKRRYYERNRYKYVAAERSDKPCAVCGNLMTGAIRGKKYCSEACRRTAQLQIQAEHRRARAKQRPPRYCQLCGVQVEGAVRKYCPNCSGVDEEQKREYQRNYKRRMAKVRAAARNKEDATI